MWQHFPIALELLLTLIAVYHKKERTMFVKKNDNLIMNVLYI